MSISYLGPLQRAVARARSTLFAPFRLETWLALGFAAFLSEWLSGGWGQAGGGRGFSGRHVGALHLHDLLPALVWGPLLAGLIVVGIVVGIVFLWLGSRGKFVFLDDVVRGRTAIVEPWNRYAHLGQSLFLWRLVFAIFAGLVMLGLLLATVGTALVGWLRYHEPLAMAPSMIGGLALVGFAGLLVGFVNLMLDDFVVPLMYRHELRVNDAWRRFLPLLRGNPGTFILYALFVLLLVIVIGAIVVVLGFATCCVGFLLLMTPYVGQVVLLPVHVAYRGLGPEFLAQFGPEFDALAGAPPQPAATPPVIPPPSTGPGASA